MDQEDTMDFNALRAKFQDEEILLRQPRNRPVLPEKPQIVPPPQSPTHHLPAGARPSILTSINLDTRMAGAPRVVFKGDKKDSRKPLIPLTKTKEKSDDKSKAGSDKDRKSTKGSKEKQDVEDKDPPKPKSGKDKKGLLHFRSKESSELVPASPPPKGTLRKMTFPGFKKISKRGSMDIEPILDSPSPDVHSGLAPLVPSGSLPSVGAPAAAHTLSPATVPEYNPMAALMPPNFIPIAPPNGPSYASLTDNVPAMHTAPWQETETLSEVEPAPAAPVSASHRSATPSPVRNSVQNSPLLSSVAGPSPAPSSPSTPPLGSGQISARAGVEVDHNGEELPITANADDALPLSASPKMERPGSALSSALERAGKTPGKKTTPADQRILQALEKARRKAASPFTSNLMNPTPEGFPPPGSLVDLPPLDYEDQRNPQAAHVNGFVNSTSEEGPDVMPELMVVPPPPPRRALPDPQVFGTPPLKPARPPSVNLTPYLSPPLEVKEILTPPDSWQQEETSEGLPEFEDTHSPEPHSPQPSEYAWGNEDYSTPNSYNPGNPLPNNVNSAYEDYGALASEFEAPRFREIPEEEQSQVVFDSSAHSTQDNRPTSMLQANNSVLENSENFYEDVNVSATKKKVKVEGTKKRKGPPKNPYDETQQPTNEEKSKLGRLGNFRTPSDKKAASDGPDEKELKKKVKQRLEKEKKELKEQKEREKREQKEKEKKENDVKKKFNITGQEEAMYQATVTVTMKGRKNDLPVERGENISIIRTTKCPKGKWLARNNSNTYGYISVDHVELDIQEMMQMGKRAATSYPDSSSNSVLDGAASIMSNRRSNHSPDSTGSFTDDSEEWTGDDEDPLTPTNSVEPYTPQGHTRTHSMPDFGKKELSAVHQHSHSDISTQEPSMHPKHEALQKLTTFFHSPKPVAEEPTTSTKEEASHTLVEEETVSSPETRPTEELITDISDMLILPPPELYADPENVTSL
ncbi:unnamed protein product [Arctogadus glacialis]